ncbi:MAG: 4-alpha-glucanotransferase [Bauldia sp.]|nr:4-alpha-glucanotransferase [Bauldia sp.]
MSDNARTILTEAARLAGLSFETVDAFGRRNAVRPETHEALLDGLGLSVRGKGEAADTLDRLRRLRGGLLPALVPVTAGGSVTIALNGPAGAESVGWVLTNDETRDVRAGNAAVSARNEFELPLPEAGYFRLQLVVGSGAVANATIIAAPPACYVSPALADGTRLWGLSAQLVALRSAGDFGVGDFGSVREAVRAAAPFGASFLGLSPLHALFAADRRKIGPYGPSSRLMLDALHIDVGEMARAQGVTPPASLRALPLADHEAVWRAKLPILERAFTELIRRRAPLPAVETHAIFEALSEQFAGEGLRSASEWPAPYRDPASPEVKRFREQHADRVGFHVWLQQTADRQLSEAAAGAKAAGMAIGLYADLAVGADPNGSEVWSARDRYAPSLSMGAPPDPLAPQGQDWGIAPLNPIVLEEQGLAGFRALIAANMRHAGALRIDHAFQLRRLYLVPTGESQLPGAYIDYPFEALLACLKIESHRAQCMVIGEDLGTAPSGFSERMMEAGALSYRVLFFERGDGGAFKPPEAYPETAIAVFTTHDLPTIRGWWAGRDIAARESLALFTPEEVEAARRQRHEDKCRLMEALHHQGLVEDWHPGADPPVEAIVRYLARSRSALAALQLEDVAGEVEQANLPGTVEGHPNWRRRISLELGEIAAPDGPLAKLARAMEREGRGEARDRR